MSERPDSKRVVQEALSEHGVDEGDVYFPSYENKVHVYKLGFEFYPVEELFKVESFEEMEEVRKKMGADSVRANICGTAIFSY